MLYILVLASHREQIYLFSALHYTISRLSVFATASSADIGKVVKPLSLRRKSRRNAFVSNFRFINFAGLYLLRVSVWLLFANCVGFRFSSISEVLSVVT